MTGYIIRRLGQAVIVTLGVTVITFLMLHGLPGGGVALARRIEGPRATPQALAAFVNEYGLNKSFWYQYWKFLDQLLHGNLGFSYHLDKSVNLILRQELSKDVLLGGISLFLAAAIAIPVGIAQAVKRNSTLDYVGTSVSFAIYAMPQYWLGIILGLIFAIHWHLLPDPVQPDAQTFYGLLHHPLNLVLPVATLTLTIYALFSRYMRSSAIDTLAQDYMRTARAKGLPERSVYARHLLRNSLIAVVTLIGLSIPGILTAGLIVEQVFNYPGVGYEYFQAAITSDFSEMMGITVLVGLTTVVGNLLADIGYAVLDPRIRY
jgi:peptide/nickel transport system permease protein